MHQRWYQLVSGVTIRPRFERVSVSGSFICFEYRSQILASVGWKYAALVTTCAALVTLFVIGRNLHYRVLCASRNFGRAVERVWKS